LENFSFCHHLAVAPLPEEAAFRLLRDADASEPLLVLLSGSSSDLPKHRIVFTLWGVIGGWICRVLREAPIEKI